MFSGETPQSGTLAPAEREDHHPGCWERTSHYVQNGCYQVLARTFWDCIVSGFGPARGIGLNLLELQPTDDLLFIGEGTGLDFEYLPDMINKAKVKAIDFSTAMVGRMQRKAQQLGIPVANCTQGDAQRLTFAERSFDKIFFPLSLGSIPNPTLALNEAERVLKPGGKIVVFEKLVDDDAHISWARRCVGLIANCIFADINRNLTTMMGQHTPLKITRYESLAGRLTGCITNPCLSSHYRIAVLTRKTEYLDLPPITAQPGAIS